jgi:hypothetical protein
MAKNATIDWFQMEAEYIQGNYITDTKTGYRQLVFPTHKQLAEKYGCSIITIREKSAREEWSKRQQFYKQKIKHKITEDKVNLLFSESAKYDARNLATLDFINQMLQAYLEPYRQMLAGKYVEDEGGLPPKINLKDLNLATDLLQKSHNLARNIFGEPLNAKEIVQELTAIEQTGKGVRGGVRRVKELDQRYEEKRKVLEELLERKKELTEKLEYRDAANLKKLPHED